MRRLLIVMLAAIAAFGAVGSSAAAQDDTAATAPVDVLQVNGLFDDIVVEEIGAAIDRADEQGSQALILQVDSRGAIVSDEVIAELLVRIDESPVVVGVWVGPSGARLYGAPAQILAVADVTGMAPGSRVGNVGSPVSDFDLGPGLNELRSRTVGLSEARSLSVFKQRISDLGIATLPNMIDALDGYTENGIELDTTIETVTDSGVVQRETIAPVRFSKLGLIDQLFHTVASPPVAYLLLLIGLALIVFEFYTAGVGVAGVVGAVCAILAAYGLAALPARWWAVGLLVAAMFAFSVDVQVGIPRFWTGVGIVLTIVGSLWLFESVEGTSLRPSWLSLLVGISGVMLTFVVGIDGAHPVRHTHRRSRVDDRCRGHRRHVGRPRGHGSSRRRSVARTHQPGDPARGRRGPAGCGDRWCHARGRAARRCGPRLPRDAQDPGRR